MEMTPFQDPKHVDSIGLVISAFITCVHKPGASNQTQQLFHVRYAEEAQSVRDKKLETGGSINISSAI